MAKFIDEAKIHLVAGDGGDGIITFRREKYVDKGGPDGGDGGNGGSIIFISTSNVHTLLDLKYKKIIKSEHGTKGQRQNMIGKRGKNIMVQVPLGTQVFSEKNDLIADLIFEGQEFSIATGGKGGKGNARFKTSRNNAPRICENGTKGEEKIVFLKLKVLADVGFVGMPSVGKSTLLSRITSAKPKIASYEFTTLSPQLGIAKTPDGNNTFVVADLPGLIEGAHLGKGLGIQFLKHIERCKIIVHMLDAEQDTKTILKNYEVITNELKSYGFGIEFKETIIVINKVDMIDEKKQKEVKAIFKKDKIIFISGITNENLNELLFEINSRLEKIKNKPIKSEEDLNFVHIKFEEGDKNKVDIRNLGNGYFSITGPWIEYWMQVIPLTTHDNIMRLMKKMRNKNIFNQMIKKGANKGDIVKLGEKQIEMEFMG